MKGYAECWSARHIGNSTKHAPGITTEQFAAHEEHANGENDKHTAPFESGG